MITSRAGWRAALALGSALAVVATSAAAPGAQERARYLDPSQPVEARVDDLLSRMTPEEKIAIVHANTKFTTPEIPRLGIPRRSLSDGPHGVREEISPDTWDPAGRTDDFATWMPVSIALASTWNPELGVAYGTVIGEEARARGKDIMLGPGMNIMRTPINGRNFEYLGEDPFLAARMAVGYIKGVQAQGVAACAKHYVGNDQEVERGKINVEADERALREIDLPPFEAAVKEAGVLSVMTAYNKVRGVYCSENAYLNNTILKGEWGFKGLVMSDWAATHSTRGAAIGGLDLEMGTDKPYDEFYFARPLLEAVRRGEVPAARLDDMARRNLRVMFASGAFDARGPGSLNTPEHQAAARRVAEEALVLLKNDGGALPLDAGKLTSIAVIGENAVRPQAHGGWSSEIKAFYEVTPLDGITRRAGNAVNVTFSLGYAEKGGGGDLVARAVTAAKQADVAVVVAGLNHSTNMDTEGSDRKGLELPYGQDELIRRVVEANPRTVVVFVAGGPVAMGPWLDRAPAVLQAWYAGMEGGNAIARALFGDVSPSGKLPCTFPRRLADSPQHALGAYPGKDLTKRFEEGVLVGYRWFDTKNIEPLFPFGHGLSYTRFEYANLELTEGAGGSVVTASFDVKNAGAREGAEVAQLYVRDLASSVARPRKELEGFQKIALKPGESRHVTIPLGQRAFAYWDGARGGWLAEKGDFEILVGGSSRDVRLTGAFRLAADQFAR